MKKIIAAAAAILTLAAVPAFAGEGNGDPFALRTPPIASTTVAAARPDTGAEDTPDMNVAFAQPEAWIGLAAGASEAIVQTANSLPAGTLDGTSAYARATRRSFAAR